MHLPFQALVKMDKTISGAPRWSRPEGADKTIKISAPLGVEESTFQGVFLKGRAMINSPDRNISFTLAYLAPGTKRDGVILDRIDWRPLTIHENTDDRSPPDLYLMDIDGTHRHSFDLNWRSKSGRPLKWLPVAEPITPDYQSFRALLAGVQNLFRISNIDLIPEPKWDRDLFK